MPARGRTPVYYNVFVRDETDPSVRDWRSNCKLEIALCLDSWVDTSIDLPAAPGHRYRWTVAAFEYGVGQTSAPAKAAFLSSGEPGPVPRPDPEKELLIRINGIRPLLERMVRTRDHFGDADLSAVEQERATLYSHLEARHRGLLAIREEVRFRRLHGDLEKTADLLGLLVGVSTRIPGGADISETGIFSGNAGPEMDRLERDLAWKLTENLTAWRREIDQRERRRVMRRSLEVGLGVLGLLVIVLVSAPTRRLALAALAPIRLLRLDKDPCSPGSVVGENFRIVRVLGEGSAGPLYEAFDTVAGRRAAIRRVREDFQRSERDLDRFLAEARKVADLSHPNLAEIYAVFLEKERIYLAGEFIEGSPLPSGKASLEDLKNVVSQTAGALDCIHEKRLVHGGLKPSNILILRDGRVKVTDTGLTLLAGRLLAKAGWNPSGLGSGYVAPEQELGQPVPQSDVFSLGVIFYELASGRAPFAGFDALADKRAGRFEALSKAAGAPALMDAVARKALDPDPARRYSSASEMFADIVDLSEG